MDDVRTPIVWNKPKPRIYNYNQEITGCFYQVGYWKEYYNYFYILLAHAWLCRLKGEAGDFLRETFRENSFARARRVGADGPFKVRKWWGRSFNSNPSFHSEVSEPVAAVSGTLLSSKATVKWPKRAMQWQVLTLNTVVFAFLLKIAFAFSPHFQLLCQGLQRQHHTWGETHLRYA